MDTMNVLTWLVRFGHVVGAAVWLGGYLMLAFIMLPALTRDKNETLVQLAHLTVRVLTYVGTGTVVLGLVLIAQTRGYGSAFRGEWGAIILICVLIAVGLLGLGDGGLRPALRRLSETGDAPARRLALVGFGLTVLAMALMTRALYAT